MKIPNVCIFIPAAQHKHSKTLFYPRYVLPLFKRMWDGQMTNPDEKVKIIPFPKGTTNKFKFRDVATVHSERAFWADYFNRAKPGLFDSAYPAETFEDAFEKLLEDMAKKSIAPVEKPVETVIPEEIKEIGLPPHLAIALVSGGFKDYISIARASLAELMEVEGLEAAQAKEIRDYATEKVGDVGDADEEEEVTDEEPVVVTDTVE